MFAAFAVGCRFEMGQHREMRRAAVRRMKERPEDFRPFVTDGSYEHYLAEMSKDRTWGDNLALQAMCAAYRAFVLVLKEEPNGDQVWMEVGDRRNPQYVFWLSLRGEHYENLLVSSQLRYA